MIEQHSPTCPLCKDGNCPLEVSYSTMLNLIGNCESRVHRCNSCTFLFIWPYLNDDELSRLYSKSYFTGKGETKSVAPASGHDYEGEYVAARMKKFESSLNLMLQQCQSARAILDVGAATGDFLSLAHQRGLSVTGIELSSYAVEQARRKHGFEFHSVNLEEFSENMTFDFIHLNHVLEHLVDPNRAVQKLDRLLKPNGLIYIEVPFQFNIVERMKYHLFRSRKKDFDVFSLHHPVFYRPKTLCSLFDRHGLKCTHLAIFDWNRYPVTSAFTYVKRIAWRLLSLFGEGNYIEATFKKANVIGSED